MSSLTPAQIAHIEQNRLLALARLTARKLGTSPPSSNSQPTSVNPGVVRNLFESPKFDSSTENTESFDFNKYKFTDTSPDKGTKRPFVDIGAVDDCDAASKHTKISQNHSENEPTPSSTQQDPFPSPSKPLPIKSGSIFGTTKHTPGKNGNIATMIKSMATISPEKSMELEFQKRPRNYSPLLSEEQCHVMDLVLDGQSLFFTGSAGTGKSFLLREIVKELKKVKAHGTVFVTATTGIAACNIGGSTIHSYAGIGFGEDSKEYLAERISKKAQHRKRWVKTKVLVIDEISMLSGELFDKLEYIARVVRKNERPFGNIQVILCGDFFQLPPVTKRGGEVDFCFESRSWNRVITNSVELTKVFRQADEKFVRILNQIRHGVVTDEADAAFKATLNNNTAIASSDGHEIIATKLEPFRKEVSSENNRRLSELPGHTVRFSAFDTGQKDQLEILAKNCAAPAILELKVDAQVILLKNLAGSKELVNGSRGVVIGFQQTRDERRREDKILPVVKFSTGELVVGMEEWTMEMGGKVVASRSQIPLALAWCLSIHKSQGQTIELVDMNLANVFESGQAYVALSRAVSLEGLRVLSFDRSKIRAHPKVLEFYKKLNPTFGTRSKTLTKNNNTNNNTNNNNMYNNNNNNNNNNVYNNNNTNINNNNNNMYNNNKNNDNNDIDLCNRDNLKRAPNDPENNTYIIYDDDLCELPLPTQHNSEQFQTPQKPTPQKPTPQNIPPQNIPPRNIPPRITTTQNASPQNISPQNIVPQTNQPTDFEDFDYCDVYEISPNNQPQNNIPQTPTTQKFNYDSDICEISPPNNAQRNSTQLNKIPQNNPTPNFQNFKYDEISDQEICNLPESPYKPPTTSKYFSTTINNTSNNFSNNLQAQNNSNLNNNNNNVNIADGFYDAVYDELLEEEEIATIDLTQ